MPETVELSPYTQFYKNLPPTNPIARPQESKWLRLAGHTPQDPCASELASLAQSYPEWFKVCTPIDAITFSDTILCPHLCTFGPAIMYPLNVYTYVTGYGIKSIKVKRFCTIQGNVPTFYTCRNGTLHGLVYGKPVIVTEGVVDAEVMSLIYPHTMSVLTARVSESQAFILSMLTNVVILSLDNDTSGQKGRWGSRKNLQKFGVRVLDLHLPPYINDPGDILEVDEETRARALTGIAQSLRSLGVEDD